MYLRPSQDQFAKLLDIVSIDSLWEGEHFGHKYGYHDFIDCAIRVRRDNGSTCEVNTLTRQVLSEATMLAFDALAETATWLLLHHIEGDARCLGIEVQSYCPLKTVPHLQQILGALSLADTVLNFLVAVDHFRELHGEIIFICRASIDNDCRPDTNWRCWHVRHKQVSWLAET